MEVKYWEGGLLLHEVEAIRRMEQTFVPSASGAGQSQRSTSGGGSFAAKLAGATGRGMWPWKGYAGFRFVNSKGHEGEFDLVVVTHKRILIIELKHWNNGVIKSSAGKWYLNDRDMGRSPVSITQNKVWLLKERLGPFRSQLPKGDVPYIDFYVVLTGNAKVGSLSDEEARHVLSFEQFLSLADEEKFNKLLQPRVDAPYLNAGFGVYDRLFLGPNVQPQHLVVSGYRADEGIFEHPKSLYKEFRAVNLNSKNDFALLRRWDFDKLDGAASKTQSGRFEIISREREVLNFIKQSDLDIYRFCLHSLTSASPDEITREFLELFELPSQYQRFNEFIDRNVERFTEPERLSLVKLLVKQFAGLHGIKVAHRDLGAHSVWLASDKTAVLSSFVAAYHQPLGTVGSQRTGISIGAIDLPEDRPGLSDHGATPFHRDVYSLGVLAWHILQKRRLGEGSIASAPEEIAGSTQWYGPVLLRAVCERPSDRFNNAGEFLDALNDQQPSEPGLLAFDDTSLDIYRDSAVKIYSAYPNDESFIDTDAKEVYRSGEVVVKLWSQIATPSLGPSLRHFLSRVSALADAAPDYLPKIQDFGMATRSSQLFLVTEHISGATWLDAMSTISDENDRFDLIKQLIHAVEHLHELGFTHGDLNPSNVMVLTDENGYRIKLIDFLDFRMDGGEAKSPRYSPINIDNCTPVERDNYAVMRMSAELLEIEWEKDGDGRYPTIDEAISVERTSAGAFLYLSRFKDAVERALAPPIESRVISITIKANGLHKDMTILPENGHVYVHFDRDDKRPKENVIVSFSGVGGSLRLLYSVTERCFVVVLSARQSDRVWQNASEPPQFYFAASIRVRVGVSNALDALSREVFSSGEFQGLVSELVRSTDKIEVSSKPRDDIVQERAQSPGDEAAPDGIASADVLPIARPKISMNRLWNSVMKAEAEARPEIEVASEPELAANREDIIIRCLGSDDVLDEFAANDKVFLTRIQKADGREQTLGQVNIRASRANEIRLQPRIGVRGVQVGEKLVLTTDMERSSFNRRKSAVDRVLDRRSIIANLLDYFDADSPPEPSVMGTGPSEEELSKYTRVDSHGNEIQLNEAQRRAFDKLLEYGPVSLLQGPPGTGKTEFIAAFVHHLVDTGKAANILLVSQSHEAVNTAAERIRSHCARLETPLDVVRFSSRDRMVSSGLQDVYSRSIVSEMRELFRAEESRRVYALRESLGVPEEYLKDLLAAEKRVNALVRRIQRIDRDTGANVDEGTRNLLESSRLDVFSDLRMVLSRDYGLPLDGEVAEIMPSVRAILARKHGIGPHEARRCHLLFSLMDDFYDRLANERSNYDEFLARSRTLVCGTCVGIGLPHLGVASNVYDWVIIDEAARATPGELAIAMQTGKRVLLVGDHRQLPPLYKDRHRDVIGREFGFLRGDTRLDSLLVSDFERVFESAYGKVAGATLRTQYRMQPPIGDLVSTVFYPEARLDNGPRAIPACFSHAPSELSAVVTWLDTSPLGAKANHEPVPGSSSIRNEEEARQIIALLKYIEADYDFVSGLAASVKEDEHAIGIICMYAEQARLISKRFSEVSWREEIRGLVKIDTVDGYQGKENRVVIVSLTRSDPDRKPGFLRLPNRINVALSRAMDRLVVVGNIKMWEEANCDLPLGRVAEFIRTKAGESDYRILPASEVKQRQM